MKKFFVVLLAFSLIGCASGRSWVLNLSQENIKNFEVLDKLAQDLITIWPQLSGALDGAKKVLPPAITTNKIEIDELVGEPGKELTKKVRAEIAVKASLLANDFAKDAYKKFAPAILDYLALIGL